jgi:hypothetical protein
VARASNSVVIVRHSSLVVVLTTGIGIQHHLTIRRGNIFAGLVGSFCRDNVVVREAGKQEVYCIYIDSRVGSNKTGKASTYHVIVNAVRLLSE